MTAKTNPTPAVSALRDDAPGVAFDTLAAVLDALYDLNRLRDPNTLPQKIVSVIPRAIACDSAVYARIEPATRSFTLSPGPPTGSPASTITRPSGCTFRTTPS